MSVEKLLALHCGSLRREDVKQRCFSPLRPVLPGEVQLQLFLPPCLSPPRACCPIVLGITRSGVSVHHSPWPHPVCVVWWCLGLKHTAMVRRIGALAPWPQGSLKAIPWKRRKVPNKVAEECGGMEGAKAPSQGMVCHGEGAAHCTGTCRVHGQLPES